MKFPRRLIRHLETPDLPLEALQSIRRLRRYLDELEAACILKARQLGASPSDIGEALGITRQAVMELAAVTVTFPLEVVVSAPFNVTLPLPVYVCVPVVVTPCILIVLPLAVRVVSGVSPPVETTPVGGLAVLIVGPNTLPVFPCPLRSASVMPPINGQYPTSPLVTEPGAALI